MLAIPKGFNPELGSCKPYYWQWRAIAMGKTNSPILKMDRSSDYLVWQIVAEKED